MPLLQPATADHQATIRCLTSLRFLAAFWVVALHYTGKMPNDLSTYTSLFEQGRLGVDFFFILSGFILTHVYRRDFERGRFNYGLFLQRRLARIYPLHLFSFLVVLAYVAAGTLAGVSFHAADAYALSEVPPNLLLLHAWGWGRMSWNYVSWSISAEWFAYLLFPLLTWLLLRVRLHPAAQVAVSLFLLLGLHALFMQMFGLGLTELVSIGIFRVLPEFLLGMALYQLSRRYDLAPRWAVPGTMVALLALLTVAHFAASDLVTVCLLGWLIFAAASLERLGRAYWLRDRRLIYLGEISFSLYMLHAIIFTVYFKALELALGEAGYATHAWWLGVPALVGCIVAAAIAYELVEVPARRCFGRADLLPSLRRVIRHALATDRA